MASSTAAKTRLLLVDDEARLTELLSMELEVEAMSWTWPLMVPVA